MKFKVGQKVVRATEWSCENSHWQGQPINKHEVNTIREIVFDKPSGAYCLRFVGIHNPCFAPGLEFSYDEKDFAPLIETDQFIEMTYTKILETTPKVSMS